MIYSTEQENFWAGDFGDEYINRNTGDNFLSSSVSFLSRALKNIEKPNSVIEFGANIGLNLKAMKILFPDADLSAIEINTKAAIELKKIIKNKNIYNNSILDFNENHKYDLVLVKGVLIHQNPDFIKDVYAKLFNACGRYILISEYYNRDPIQVVYRGHSNRLFKRDWAGEILEQYKSLKLIDYGFIYYRDPKFPQDDENWFLLENLNCNFK